MHWTSSDNPELILIGQFIEVNIALPDRHQPLNDSENPGKDVKQP